MSRDDFQQIGRIYDDGQASIITWGMGITQHKHAVATVQMLVNVLLLKGNIGKTGAGAAPIRGHSNVQGDRTMGIWERPPAVFLDRLAKEFDFQPPREPGYDVIGSIKAMEEGRAHVFLALSDFPHGIGLIIRQVW